jgi:excisionase family DNA binding protein
MSSIASLLAELPARWLGFGVLKPMRRQLSYARFVAGDEVLTIKQVAAELGVPNTRAMDLVRKGRLATAVPRTGGPATWRIARAELEAFRARERAEQVAREERGRAKRLRELAAAWATLSDADRERLRAEIPKAIYRPLAKLADAQTEDRAAARADLAAAYGSRTEAGIEELALAMPHGLFWAIARVADDR